MFTRTLGFVLPVFAAGVVLAGCGSGDRPQQGTGTGASVSAPAPRSGHNQADITFARQMIPHHRQALEMASDVRSRTGNQRILDLADGIRRAQDPEIRTMTEWLRAWGAPASGTGHGGMPDMDHGSMPGAMSAGDMEKLGEVKDAEFDRLWLELMIRHHQGAIDMAKTELAQGSDVDARRLAQRIADTQQSEITTMNALLAQN
jgi:uncharacterized protein (DUF305 family)